MTIKSAINKMKKSGLSVQWNNVDYRYEVDFGKGMIMFSPNGKNEPDSKIACFEVVDNSTGFTWIKSNLNQALNRLVESGLNK